MLGFIVGLVLGLVAGYSLRHNMARIQEKFPGVAKVLNVHDKKEEKQE